MRRHHRIIGRRPRPVEVENAGTSAQRERGRRAYCRCYLPLRRQLGLAVLRGTYWLTLAWPPADLREEPDIVSARRPVLRDLSVRDTPDVKEVPGDLLSDRRQPGKQRHGGRHVSSVHRQLTVVGPSRSWRSVSRV
jgi:hypothetical protein